MRRRFILPSVALLVAVALLALLAFGVANQGTSSSIDSQVAHGDYPPAPSATLALPNLGAAGSRTLASLRGRVVVVNIFASWCQPCQAEAPILEREQAVLRAHGGTVLGITYLDNTNDSESFVHQWHITYPVVRDIDGNLVRSFGTDAVPETFVINRQGHIRALRRFQLTGNWLSQTLTPLLEERS